MFRKSDTHKRTNFHETNIKCLIEICFTWILQLHVHTKNADSLNNTKITYKKGKYKLRVTKTQKYDNL